MTAGDMRVVISGVGVIAPTGADSEAHWRSCLESSIALTVNPEYESAGYRSVLQGTVAGFNPRDHMPPRLVVQTDRWTQLGLAATAMALADGKVNLGEFGEFDVGVVTGSSSGGNEYGQKQIELLWSEHPDHVSVYQSIAWFYAATTGQISIRHALKGPTNVVVSEQAAGLDAIAQARRLVREGTRLVLAGGAEAPLSPYAHVCQEASGLLSGNSDPTTSYRPFDAAADGYTPGEGGAMFTVESHASAVDRGARIHGEIAGFAATFDPPPSSGLPPGLTRTVELALADAALSASDVDVVFADGAGVPKLDRAEATSIAETFGPRGVPVTAPKALGGRLYAGGSALDVATALRAMAEGVIPPTPATTDVPAIYALDLVITARPAKIRVALVLARGYGGFNSAMVIVDGSDAQSQEKKGVTMNHFTVDDLRPILVAAIGDLDVDESVIEGAIGDVPFIDLGIDSLALMEVTSTIRRRHGVRVDIDKITEGSTVGDLVTVVDELVAQANAGSEVATA